MNTKNKFSYLLQHFLQALFCLASINLAIITVIAYISGIIQIIFVLSLLSIGGDVNNGKILTIVGLIAGAIIILGILIGLFILLYKLCKRYFKPLKCDNLEYFYVYRRWIDVIFAFIMWAVVFFGVRNLYNLAMTFDINIICYVLSAIYLLVALTMLIFWLYYKIWFIRLPKEKKAQILELFKEIEEKRKEKAELNKSLKEKSSKNKTRKENNEDGLNNEITEEKISLENENVEDEIINQHTVNQNNTENNE